MKFAYLLPATALFILGCTSRSTSTESQTSIEATPVQGVCIWDQVSLRSVPSGEGKWLTPISIGEQLTVLGEEAIDSANNNRKYVKVKLADETEGWCIADFIVANGQVAVFTEDINLYRRPDLLTKTDVMFSQMDIVAIKSTQDDWSEVMGKRSGGKWIESGWVKTNTLSQEAIDVAVAKFARIATKEEKEEDQITKLTEILNNTDFSSSVFLPSLRTKLEEMTMGGQAAENEEVMEADSTEASI